MPAVQRGVRPAVAISVLAVLFVGSVGVSAAASVALSSEPMNDAAVAAGQEAPLAPDEPAAPKPSESTSAEPPDSQREIPRVTTASTKATKAQVKSNKASLCKAEPSKLPKIDFRSGTRQWIQTLEVIAADLGFAPGAIDGVYTVQTRNAVRALERDLGLAVDGTMDASAWQGLWNRLCAPEPSNVAPQSGYTPPSSGGGDGGLILIR